MTNFLSNVFWSEPTIEEETNRNPLVAVVHVDDASTNTEMIERKKFRQFWVGLTLSVWQSGLLRSFVQGTGMELKFKPGQTDFISGKSPRHYISHLVYV